MSQWLNKFLPETQHNATDSVDTITTPSRLSVGDPCDISTTSTVSVSYTRFDQTYYQAYYLKKLADAECVNNLSKEEAANIAYNDTLSEWIYTNPPEGYEFTHCAYCKEPINFNEGGFQAWGGVYCCYTSQDNEHLRPYLQSRIREAKAYLNLIKINQPLYEANNECK